MQNNLRRKFNPVVTMNRLQSTSTMDLVSMDEKGNRIGSIFSTLQSTTGERDYSAMALRRPRNDDSWHWRALLDIASERLKQEHPIAPRIAVSEEMDLVQAAERRSGYDKILLLLNHGEHASQIRDDLVPCQDGAEDRTITKTLTGKGVGQALSLSRRTATFCNQDTGLVPELFVIEPSIKAAQTAFLSFPYDTPFSSIEGTQWICHPSASGIQVDQTRFFCRTLESFGVDCSMIDLERPCAVTSSRDLFDNSIDLIKWLYGRDEKVIAGKLSHVLANNS